jgi:hypothetical protein
VNVLGADVGSKDLPLLFHPCDDVRASERLAHLERGQVRCLGCLVKLLAFPNNRFHRDNYFFADASVWSIGRGLYWLCL